jgi:hypothetical protein
MDINTLGEITGRSQISSTEFEAFIATPKRKTAGVVFTKAVK